MPMILERTMERIARVRRRAIEGSVVQRDL